MAFTHSIDTERRIAYVRGEGPFEIEAALDAPLELFANPDFESDFGIVIDVSEIQFRPSPAEVIAIARNLVRFRGLFEHRLAVVVKGRNMLRAAEVSAALAGAGGVEIQVFARTGEAEAWVREDRNHAA